MPTPAETIVHPQEHTISVNLEPVYGALNSLMLITKVDQLSGLADWVSNTRNALTSTELEKHRLIMEGLFFALLPQRKWPSFEAYVDGLETMDPLELRDRLINAYLEKARKLDEPTLYTSIEQVLSSADGYVSFIVSCFGEDGIDPELEKQAYAYLVKPSAMQGLIISHIRMMWDRFLAGEWRRVEPMLTDSVTAFRTIDLNDLSFAEAISFVTGRQPTELDWPKLEETNSHLVFVPSAHIGPYQGIFHSGDRIVMVFGARLPEGTAMNAPDLSRNELVMRLNALADDTRLRILRLIADEGEQSSKEVMSELQLSQSTTSRLLTQLSATGFLNVRRCDGAKCYSLAEDRLRDTFQAVLAFLAVSP